MRSQPAKDLGFGATGLGDLPWKALGHPLVSGYCVTGSACFVRPSKTGCNPRPCGLGINKPSFWTIRQTMTPTSLDSFVMCIGRSHCPKIHCESVAPFLPTGAQPLKRSRPIVPPLGFVLLARKVVFTKVIRQELEDRPAFKADHAVFLNGFTKVSAVVGKLLVGH